VAKGIKTTEWIWTQGNHGFSLVISLRDKENLSDVDTTNYNFFVNVRRGESPKNVYTQPCRVIDNDDKKIEYIVQQGDLLDGDCYYYITPQGIEINGSKKISGQETLKLWVARNKESLG